ncbi:hypothetical protein CYMTET_7239 [Cymbomonas tetramitiformis]|uniref:Fe2OG dioxygenase domain-containing protein n=1 Tax=Cymbomonas tetramitiformis TaxID=36881 RepID=A0AAE0LHN4_9CHLO|nr:hypothetical protein CYMTET_7239 [Cymbomonas tetramitiformis]
MSILVGKKVRKDFGTGGKQEFYEGKLIDFDNDDPQWPFQVQYEDGDQEDLTWEETLSILVDVESFTDEEKAGITMLNAAMLETPTKSRAASAPPKKPPAKAATKSAAKPAAKPAAKAATKSKTKPAAKPAPAPQPMPEQAAVKPASAPNEQAATPVPVPSTSAAKSVPAPPASVPAAVCPAKSAEKEPSASTDAPGPVPYTDAATAVSELNTAIDSIESRYQTSGTVNQKVTLALNTPAAAISFPMSNTQAKDALAGLLAAAVPSAFGHGNQTVFDSSVRVAKELKPEHFTVDFNPEAAGILEQVRMALVPEAGSVRAELHKLNVMDKGGFFKPHKDTPRGADTCFGTLVVALPVCYEGGDLVLSHGANPAVTFAWGKKLEPRYNWYTVLKNKDDHVPAVGLQWGAFFGDVVHEVRPVTSGHRITLTYTLHRDAAPDPNVDALLTRANTLYHSLSRALASPDFMPAGGHIGFECRHLYEESQLAQAESKLAAGGANAYASKLKLKNEDAVVAAVFAGAGLPVTCVRILSGEDLDYVLAKMPTKKDSAKFGSKEYIENSFRAMAVTPEEIDSYTEGQLSEVTGGDVEWIGSYKSAASKWAERYFGEYFGNEASHTEFYTKAAFMAEVPAFSSRRAPAGALTGVHIHSKAAPAVCHKQPKMHWWVPPRRKYDLFL